MITQLITRLQAAGTDYQTVAHAWTLDTIDQIRDPAPLALLVPGPLNTEPAASLPIRQRTTETVVVVTICPWVDLDTLRNQLYGALIGYQHAPEYTELEHRQGEIQRINGNYVHWMDAFAADRWIQGTNP